MSDPEVPPAASSSSAGHAEAAAPAAAVPQFRKYDDKYAPGFFYGKSSEDAEDYFGYLERYAALKHMSEGDVLDLLPVLLKDCANDFMESLAADQKNTLANFKAAFLQRFGRSKAQQWQDMTSIWTEVQGDQTVDDYVRRLTHMAKRLPDLDDTMLMHAITRGLRPAIRTHVLQSGATTMADLLASARISEMATTTASADSNVNAVIDQLRHNNLQQVAAMEQLSARLDKLAVSSIDSSRNDVNDDTSRRRASPRRVRFNEPERRSVSRSPSPGRYYDNNRRPPAPSRDFGRPPTPVRFNSRQPHYNRQPYNDRAPARPIQRAPCYRCGMPHIARRCIAVNARCINCNKVGHFASVCRSARRGNYQRI